MGQEVILFSSEEKMDLGSLTAFLRSLADRLDQNEVVLRQGTEEIRLAIPNQVVFEVKVEEELKRTRTQRSLELEIEWYEGEGEAPGGVSLG